MVLFVFTSCTEEKEKPKRPEVKMEYQPLVTEDDSGRYTEWYPGHKQLKMKGRKNINSERVGVWKYYSERGVELSINVYTNGKKNGHTIVKYPNGAIHYSGEYKNDEAIGIWKFYDEQGELIETKNYDNL